MSTRATALAGSDAGPIAVDDAAQSDFEPTSVHYGALPAEGTFTIAELDQRAEQLEEEARAAHAPLETVRRLLRMSRAVVEVSVLTETPVHNPGEDLVETHFGVQLLRVLGSVQGYSPSVSMIVVRGGRLGTSISVFGDQPRLRVGRRYVVIKGLGELPIWRGHSHLDVLEVSDATLLLERHVIPRSDFDAILPQLGADAGAAQ